MRCGQRSAPSGVPPGTAGVVLAEVLSGCAGVSWRPDRTDGIGQRRFEPFAKFMKSSNSAIHAPAACLLDARKGLV